MSYPGVFAKTQPDHPAVINTLTGDMLTYSELDERSNQIAQLLAAEGFSVGDHLAIMMENNLRYFEVMWAAMRSGLIITPVNRYFTAEEAAYVVNDCGAKALFISQYIKVKEELCTLVNKCELKFIMDGECDGYLSLNKELSGYSGSPLANEMRGQFMFYSSGTTGRPKGILRNQPSAPMSEGLASAEQHRSYGIDQNTVYLNPAPVYHAAPLGYCMGVMGLGGTVAMMPRFEAEEALKAIQNFRVTHSQWVPTMFVRLLKLPADVRNRYDLSSHRFAVHAAAPCPVEVKRQMIDWWGMIVNEYYAGSEGNGSTWISADEWVEHPGSVGKPRNCKLHICDEDGKELRTGETGIVYFEQPMVSFRYHNDPGKTRDSQHPDHETWSTMGDVGHVDEEGYLYLTDRKNFMIISGGVNIYPQEIEDALVLHDKVVDAAVIGVPNEEMGEEVKAVVQLAEGIEGSTVLAEELLEYTRQKVASYMVPRSFDFVEELPRLPTGKLYKKKLRDSYLPGN